MAHLSQSFQINSKRRRAESFEVCWQWLLLNVQITTMLFAFAVQKYIYLNLFLRTITVLEMIIHRPNRIEPSPLTLATAETVVSDKTHCVESRQIVIAITTHFL